MPFVIAIWLWFGGGGHTRFVKEELLMRYFAALLLLSLLIVPRVSFAGGGSWGRRGYTHQEYCQHHPGDYRFCGRRYRDSDDYWSRQYPHGYQGDDWRRSHEQQGKHYQKQGDWHGQSDNNEHH